MFTRHICTQYKIIPVVDIPLLVTGLKVKRDKSVIILFSKIHF